MASLYMVAAALIFAAIAWWRTRRTKCDGPLPPGPKGYPLVGNVLDMPEHHEWETYAKWGEQYGA
jgi:hypothetical protein